MGIGSEDAIRQLRALMDHVEERLKCTFQLVDCLNWRVDNEINMMFTKPIVPIDLYRAVRDSQLTGLSGYSKEGLPVFAIDVGLSTFDKASVNYYGQCQSHIQINEYQDRITLIMDYSSLPHFCKREGSGSSRHAPNGAESCYSLDHPFRQQLYNYIKQQAVQESSGPIKQGSVHVWEQEREWIIQLAKHPKNMKTKVIELTSSTA